MNEPYTLPVQVQPVHRKGPKFDLYVPRVVGLKNQEAQNRINASITRQVESMLRELGYYRDPKNTEIVGFYEIKTNERGVLSLALNIYGYTTPAAHGLTLLKSLTFDIDTGKSYSLGELFAPGSDYVRRISDIIRVQIKERGIQLLDGFVSIRPDQDYYVADKALVVYFQLYQITPGYFGFPMFPISVYSLESIIPDDSLIQPMLINQ